MGFAPETAIAIFPELKSSLDRGYQHDPVQVIAAQRSPVCFATDKNHKICIKVSDLLMGNSLSFAIQIG
ncbi:MAG TPA: hypothetical protein V6D16_11885 [Candidatus Obscuribacterales bacterium]